MLKIVIIFRTTIKSRYRLNVIFKIDAVCIGMPAPMLIYHVYES